MRISAFTTASPNAAHGRDSRARVTRTSGRSLVHLLAACLAAFAAQHAAHAQLTGTFNGGTYNYSDSSLWTGGVINNTITGSYTGASIFQFATSSTTMSSTINTNNLSPNANNLGLTFRAASGFTPILTFNGGGFSGNTRIDPTFHSSLTLDLASGTVTFANPAQASLNLDSKLTGTATLHADVGGGVTGRQLIISNTANTWTGKLLVSDRVTIAAPNAIKYGVSLEMNPATQLLLPSGTTTFLNPQGGSSGGRIFGGPTPAIAILGLASTVNTTLSAQISDSDNVLRAQGSLGLRKLESGTLTLANAQNAYSALTVIQGGVLNISGLADGGVTGAFTGANGGTTGTIASTAGIQVGMNIFKMNRSSLNPASDSYAGTVSAVTSSTTFTVTTPWTGSGTATTGLISFYSPIGISSSSGGNLVFDGGQLQYSGSAGGSTNRLFSIGTGGGGIIANGTTGVLRFTGGGTIGFNGQSGARTFRLSGTNTGTNTLTTALADNGGQTALVKSGLGRWVLGGTHAYTGTTQIEAGRLTIGAGASIGSSRTVVVGTAAGSGARLDVTDTAYAFTGSQTLMGSGTVAGGGSGPTTVTINGKLSPGNSPGLLTFADTSVALGSTGNVIMEITGSERGTQYDAIDITGGANGGGLTYGGTMTLNFTQTFASGTFDLFKYELNETSGTFGSIVFDPASVYLGTWGLVGDVWKVTTGTTVMEFRNNVVEGGVSYGQLVIVPEPLTLGLLGIGGGIAVVGLRHLRRRKANGANGTSTSDSAADAA